MCLLQPKAVRVDLNVLPPPQIYNFTWFWIIVITKSVKLEQKINKHPNSLKTKLANSVKLVRLLQHINYTFIWLGCWHRNSKSSCCSCKHIKITSHSTPDHVFSSFSYLIVSTRHAGYTALMGFNSDLLTKCLKGRKVEYPFNEFKSHFLKNVTFFVHKTTSTD